MVTIKRRFFHVKQNLNRFKDSWSRKMHYRYWKVDKRKAFPKKKIFFKPKVKK